MRHTRGRQYTEASPGASTGYCLVPEDEVLWVLDFWPGLAARVEPGRTSNGRYGWPLGAHAVEFSKTVAPSCGREGDSFRRDAARVGPSGQWSVAHPPSHRKAPRTSTATVQRSTAAAE